MTAANSEGVVLILFAGVLGAMIGSFLNVVIARLPAGESIVRPRSRCPKCGDMIPSYLNVPVLSWLVLRGRCRACKAPISIRYPTVELLTALLFAAVTHRFGYSLATLAGMILSGGLVAITFIDIDIWEIPDEISLPGILVGALLRPIAFGTPWYDGLFGAVIGGGSIWFVRWFFFKLRGIEGIGFGDVKLLAMTGAFLGPRSILPTVLVGSIVGAGVGVLLVALGKRQLEPESAVAESPSASEPAVAVESPPLTAPEAVPAETDGDDEDDWVPPPNAVPFGPFLALGAMTELLLGPGIMDALVRALMR